MSRGAAVVAAAVLRDPERITGAIQLAAARQHEMRLQAGTRH